MERKILHKQRNSFSYKKEKIEIHHSLKINKRGVLISSGGRGSDKIEKLISVPPAC